jgi:phosphomannomutase
VGPDGIVLDAEAGARVRALAEEGPARAGWDGIGVVEDDAGAIARHLDLVLALPEVDAAAVRAKGFTVALDCVRGAGGTTMPALLERLGCRVAGINLETDGRFPRPPEPLPEHLGDLGRLVRESGADVGIAVDPDVDRLAIVDEAGEAIGEDYTLAFGVRAVLGQSGRREDGKTGSGEGASSRRSDVPSSRPTVVANLSTSLVVADAAREAGARYLRAPVGEANVARMMRDEGAVIGGEGNGGVILPALHIGRDAPLAAALLLTLLARTGRRVSELVQAAPRYCIVKAKAPRSDLGAAYAALRARHPDAEADERDGLRLGWADRWLHLRPSGTEPIVRLIAEAPTAGEAEALIQETRALLGAPS